MDQRLKVFLSTALGSLIGALIALSVWQPIWWIGMLAGGLVGYLSYEWREVISAILVAWAATRSNAVPVSKDILIIIGTLALVVVVFGANAIPLIALLWLFRGYDPGFPMTSVLIWATVVPLTLIVEVFIGFRRREEESPSFWSIFYLFYLISPIGVYGYYLPRFLFLQLPKGIAEGVVRCARFIQHLFILIHSEERLLCGVDAAIGAGVGYLMGNALVGALVGGLLGVANYEFISKRWLHLVPTNSR